MKSSKLLPLNADNVLSNIFGVTLSLDQWFLTLLEVLNPESFIGALAKPFVI